MKYCIDFYGDRNLDILDEVDEINIDISKIKDLNDLGEFCELHKNQRINLCIEDYDIAIEKNLFYFAFDFQQEKRGIYNIVIRLPYLNKIKYNELIEKYPMMRIFFRYGVNDWDTLWNFLDYHVTDVYIIEGLGFELDKISPIVHGKGAQVRVYPNVAASSWGKCPGLLTFWIRPEDTKHYEDYIDIYEFVYERYDQQKVYYDIYAKDKKWYGDLSEIIIGLEDPINSTCLLPRFAEKRIRCGRQCIKGGNCQMCDVILKLSKSLQEKDLKIEEDETNG